MQVYLDNAATTRLDKRVEAVMKKYHNKLYANASAIHLLGQQNYLDLMDAKEKIAKILGGESRSVFFTASATESNNMIIKGVAWANRGGKRNKIIISEIEHPCVREAAHSLKEEGFEVKYIKANKKGIITKSELEKVIDDKTLLVSVMMVNNEIGTINNVKQLAKVAHDNGAYFHTDAVQAIPYIKIDISKMGIDMLSLSAHKFNGPKGVGLAYIKSGIKIKPLLVGGGQEEGKRAGTYNLPGIMGMKKALELAYEEREEYIERVKELRDYLWNTINKEIPDLQLNGDLKNRIPANLNVMFYSIEGEAILIDLSRQGVSVSTGSACSATNLKGSYVLKSIGLDKNYLNSNVRFSLGKYNTKQEIDYTIKCLKKTVKRLRSFSPIK
jgi:cysteine desulfurase